jgi:hypothetical protein
MDHPDDIGRCARCGRWQRRRHAYVEEYGPDDREAWCASGHCVMTWRDGIGRRVAAQHDPAAPDCDCASCLPEDDAALMAYAADKGMKILPPPLLSSKVPAVTKNTSPE